MIQRACNFSNYLLLFQNRIKQPGHNSQLSPASRTGYKLPNVLTLEKSIGRSYIKYSCIKDTRINRLSSGFAVILVQLQHKSQYLDQFKGFSLRSVTKKILTKKNSHIKRILEEALMEGGLEARLTHVRCQQSLWFILQEQTFCLKF